MSTDDTLHVFHCADTISLYVAQHITLRTGILKFDYSLFTLLLGKVVSFDHATQIPAREVLLVSAINMFLCHLETRKRFSQRDVIV